jgi:hypothetical protein
MLNALASANADRLGLTERKRVRLALLVILAAFGVLGWSFGWLRTDPVIASRVIV